VCQFPLAPLGQQGLGFDAAQQPGFWRRLPSSWNFAGKICTFLNDVQYAENAKCARRSEQLHILHFLSRCRLV
jgi:hypothetical protein